MLELQRTTELQNYRENYRTTERTTEQQRELQNYYLTVENHRLSRSLNFLTNVKKTLLTR